MSAGDPKSATSDQFEQAQWLLDGLVFWNRLTSSGKRLLDGRYSLDDAMADFDGLVCSTSTAATRLLDSWFGGPSAASKPVPDEWTAEMTVLPTVTHRPLTLRTAGLRRVGQGGVISVRRAAVRFEPPIVPAGANRFRVRVSFDRNEPKTFVYEGDVTADEVAGPVSDKIRPNNRDGGPLL